MKILFFGLGSIGQRHAKTLLKQYDHELFAFRTGKSDLDRSLAIREIHAWNEVDQFQPDIAFITNPTSKHIDTAIRCAKLGCKLFIEKPLGASMERLDELIDEVNDRNLVTYVAYNLRFHPVIRKVKEYLDSYKMLHMRASCTSFLPDWHLGRDHTKNYSAVSTKGGGVILDLSHELDYISYLCGGIEQIKGRFGRVGNVTQDAEDYADFLVSTSKGAVSVHLNFMSRIVERTIKIDFDEFSLSADLNTGCISQYRDGPQESCFEFPAERHITYEGQMKYFFENIDNPSMMNNVSEAVVLFRQIMHFKHQTVHA